MFIRKTMIVIFSCLALLAASTPVSFAESHPEILPTIEPTEIPTPAPTWATLKDHMVFLGIPVGDGSGETKRSQCIAKELILGGQARNLDPLTQAQRVEALKVQKLLTPKKAVRGSNISIKCQMGYFVSSGEVSRVFAVSTGTKGHNTTIGTFKVSREVNGWYESKTYKGAMMYRPKFFDRGIAFHGMTNDRSVRSYPASHGCVRMLKKDVDWIWKNWDGKLDRVRTY